MRATGLNHRNSSTLPPIRATIVAGENDVGVRISDQGWAPLYSPRTVVEVDLYRWWLVISSDKITLRPLLFLPRP